MSQQIEIPAFLLEMSQQMHQQSNRCTAEPIWQVRCKRYLPTEEGYDEHHWEIVDTDGGTTLYRSDESDMKQALAEWLAENDHQWCSNWLFDNEIETNYPDIVHVNGPAFDEVFINAFIEDFDVESDHDQLPDPLKKFHLQETEEVIKTCLTEADARAFIARKQHDYPKLYTYVESMVFCPQMIQLRHWIMSLTTPEVKA
ncbi:ead/Ea22-like family protein [Shewanella mangrovisoli]|uniref:ead/Ea22-like family protein n=1 Tax=Shewanella mangrovisoli TaxID=2864211 RepID=UPI0035B826EE